MTHALAGDWFAHSQFFAVFLLGVVLARTPLMWPRMAQLRWLALALAIAAWLLLIQGSWLRAANGVSGGVVGSAVYSVQQWCAMVWALGIAVTYLNHDGPLRRYLTQAVFPVYILHQTILIVLAYALLPFRLLPGVEGGLLVSGTLAISLIGFEVIRRLGWVRPLFGLALKDRF